MENAEVLDLSIRKSTDSEEHEEKEKNRQRQPRGTKRIQRIRPAYEKLQAIERIRAGVSKAKVARDMDIPESTIRGWCKAESSIRQCVMANSGCDSEASAHSVSPTSSMESRDLANELPDDGEPNATVPQTLHEYLWQWLMAQQRLLSQQLMPLVPNDSEDAGFR